MAFLFAGQGKVELTEPFEDTVRSPERLLDQKDVRGSNSYSKLVEVEGVPAIEVNAWGGTDDRCEITTSWGSDEPDDPDVLDTRWPIEDAAWLAGGWVAFSFQLVNTKPDWRVLHQLHADTGSPVVAFETDDHTKLIVRHRNSGSSHPGTTIINQIKTDVWYRVVYYVAMPEPRLLVKVSEDWGPFEEVLDYRSEFGSYATGLSPKFGCYMSRNNSGPATSYLGRKISFATTEAEAMEHAFGIADPPPPPPPPPSTPNYAGAFRTIRKGLIAIENRAGTVGDYGNLTPEQAANIVDMGERAAIERDRAERALDLMDEPYEI